MREPVFGFPEADPEIASTQSAAGSPPLVIYTDHHFNTFFLDNFPTFAIGIADETSGPHDQTPMPSYRVAFSCGCRTIGSTPPTPARRSAAMGSSRS
jgi:hypothetical protein